MSRFSMEGLVNGDADHQVISIKPEQFFILFPLGLSVLLMVLSFLKRRTEREVCVNCWFCNQNFKVPRGNANCFDCPYCEQYNGFKEDGDYNKPIPAQHNEDLNYPIMGGPPKQATRQSWSNGLCSQCNHNQAVKVKLTAAFQPVLQHNEDEELKAYVAHLENLYRLCWRCQVQVRTTLEQQNVELARLLPAPPPCATECVAEVSRKTKKEKLVLFSICAGEFLCLVCSVCMVCVHAHSHWYYPWFSHVEPLLRVLTDLQTSFVGLSSYSPSICLTALSTTFFTTGLDKAQKGLRSVLTRLSLWGLLLLHSQTTFPVLKSYLSTAIFSGDKFVLSILLMSLCSLTLWKSLTAKQKQHRIQKKNLKKNTSGDEECRTQKSSSVADWIAACNDQQNVAQSSTSECSSGVSRILGPLFLPKRLQLSHSFDQLHISLSKPCTPSHPKADFKFTVVHNYQTYGKSFSDAGDVPNQCRPLLKPAQFYAPRQSISKSSWVAGGLWLPPGGGGDKPKVETTFSASPSMLTPPPSLDGSQTSQPGSIFNEGFASSGKSVFEDCGRSWPPSHASLRRRGSPQSSAPKSSELKAEQKPVAEETKYSWTRLHFLKRGAIVLSVCCNLLVIVHFIWRQTQDVR